MKSKHVKDLEGLTKELGEIITDIVPVTPSEWDAMEKMQAAHKQLRSIDISELLPKIERAALTK